jgi:hypothetical protein
LEPVAFAAALPSALRISSTQDVGIEQLKEKVLGMLVDAKAGGGLQSQNSAPVNPASPTAEEARETEPVMA